MGDVFKPYYWIRVLEKKYLEPMERGDIRRLAISAPSQHGKSTVAANLFASRYLAMNPTKHVTVVSYGDDRAQAIVPSAVTCYLNMAMSLMSKLTPRTSRKSTGS